MTARRILLAAAATAVLIGTIDAAAQSPRRPQPPPGWQAIESDIEADRARKAEAPLQTPPALASEARLAEQVGAQIAAARATPPELSDAARAALKTAEGADVERCGGLRYRAVIDPTTKADADMEVYLLAEAAGDALVIGRHFRITVSADGARVRATQASSLGCIQLQPVGQQGFPWTSHVLSCTPNPFHVYLSLVAKHSIYVTTSVGTWRIATGQIAFISRKAAPCAASSLPEIEGRWIAVPPRPDSTDRDHYRIALVYLDPAAGFTAVNGGSARVDENGRFHWVERQPGHYSMRTRMQGVPFAHILSDEDLALLELPKVPEWLGLYRDTSDSVTRAINRGRALNHVGESRLALESLLSARSERPGPDAERLAFELAYAFNAIGKHDRAIEVATESLGRRDNDYLTCRELGFAYFRSSRLEDAAKTYARCLAIWPDGEREIKTEVAVNLAGVYRGLGAAQQCRRWLDQALEWSSSGSRQRSELERMKQDADACAR